jgi:hypothetical protein
MATYATAFPSVDSATVQLSSGVAPSSFNQISALNNIRINENNALVSAFNGAEQSATNANTYGALFQRNVAIQSMANQLTAENKKINDGSKDTYTRQAEINEWQAQNKYDTLFFLQTLFVYFCIAVVALYLRQSGILPNTALYIILGLFGFIVFFILWNRASYTATSRDKRYWNRRYIGLDDAASGLSAKISCSA